MPKADAAKRKRVAGRRPGGLTPEASEDELAHTGASGSGRSGQLVEQAVLDLANIDDSDSDGDHSSSEDGPRPLLAHEPPPTSTWKHFFVAVPAANYLRQRCIRAVSGDGRWYEEVLGNCIRKQYIKDSRCAVYLHINLVNWQEIIPWERSIVVVPNPQARPSMA